MKRARVPGWVWGVLVVGHAIALAWALGAKRWEFPDSDRYLQAADNLWVHGELYARPWPEQQPKGQAIQEFTIRPIGYPVLVLGLNGAGRSPVMLLLMQNVLSLLNISLVLRWWAGRAQPSGRQWWWAMLLVASFPAQFIYANAVMSEIPLQAVVVGIDGAVGLFIETRQRRYFVGLAGLGIVALLLKPVFYPLSALMAAAGLLLAWKRRGFRLLAWVGLVPMAVVGLYMGWNWQRTGYFHFSSITEINLLHYNAAGVLRQVEGPAAEEQWVAGVLREANATSSFAARQHVIQARAGAVLWAHPVVYARQHLQGMMALFLDPGRFDLSQFLGLSALEGGGLLAQLRAGGLLRALTRLPLGLLAGLGLVLLANATRLVLAVRGFGRLRHGEPAARYGRWVAVGLLGYVAALTGPLGAARFLVPVWPLLLGLALVGLGRAQRPAKPAAGAGANA